MTKTSFFSYELYVHTYPSAFISCISSSLSLLFSADQAAPSTQTAAAEEDAVPPDSACHSDLHALSPFHELDSGTAVAAPQLHTNMPSADQLNAPLIPSLASFPTFSIHDRSIPLKGSDKEEDVGSGKNISPPRVVPKLSLWSTPKDPSSSTASATPHTMAPASQTVRATIHSPLTQSYAGAIQTTDLASASAQSRHNASNNLLSPFHLDSPRPLDASDHFIFPLQPSLSQSPLHSHSTSSTTSNSSTQRQSQSSSPSNRALAPTPSPRLKFPIAPSSPSTALTQRTDPVITAYVSSATATERLSPVTQMVLGTKAPDSHDRAQGSILSASQGSPSIVISTASTAIPLSLDSPSLVDSAHSSTVLRELAEDALLSPDLLNIPAGNLNTLLQSDGCTTPRRVRSMPHVMPALQEVDEHNLLEDGNGVSSSSVTVPSLQSQKSKALVVRAPLVATKIANGKRIGRKSDSHTNQHFALVDSDPPTPEQRAPGATWKSKMAVKEKEENGGDEKSNAKHYDQSETEFPYSSTLQMLSERDEETCSTTTPDTSKSHESGVAMSETNTTASSDSTIKSTLSSLSVPSRGNFLSAPKSLSSPSVLSPPSRSRMPHGVHARNGSDQSMGGSGASSPSPVLSDHPERSTPRVPTSPASWHIPSRLAPQPTIVRIYVFLFVLQKE